MVTLAKLLTKFESPSSWWKTHNGCWYRMQKIILPSMLFLIFVIVLEKCRLTLAVTVTLAAKRFRV